MTKLKETKPVIVKLLYQIMYDVHQILSNNGIKYWADGGTLLGAVRHEGIIPWDDDVDIGILSKDVKRLLDLEKDFERCGYSMTKIWFGYKIFYTNRKNIVVDGQEESYSFPSIDVLLYRKFSDGKYHLSLKAARDTWPKEVWAENDLFPIREYKFGDFQIAGPAKYQTYFDKYYGKDWNKIAYREYDHEKEESVESIKVKLTNKMRQPAKPTDKIRNRECVKACWDGKKSELEADFWMQKQTKSCSRSGGCYNNFDTKMGVYVVNCSIHKKRYEKFKKYANKAGVKYCRVPCILGNKLTQSLICEMINKKIVYPKADMTTIEISINMSHYNCWQKLVNSCQDYALIFEDDVELKKDFIEKLNLVMSKLEEIEYNDFSVFYLHNGNWAGSDEDHEFITRVAPGITIVKETTDYNAGAAAYIISRKYAEFLMSRFFPIKLPQDIIMGNYFNKGNHLSLKMKYRKKDDCYISPLLDLECGGPGGTGTLTTQQYSDPSIFARWKCKKC